MIRIPYPNIEAAKKDSFPTTADGAPLTIAQINHLARIHDSIKESGSADNPMAAAWKTWKGLYKKQDNKWVKKDTRKASDSFTYVSELPLKLFEEGLPLSISEIQILRAGNWDHPVYGKFSITYQDLVKFKDSFDNKVRRVDIAIDTEHYPEKGAAGWIQSLFLKGEEELWALVEWTKWGVEAIKGKLFRYISPEFDFNYEDPEDNKKYKNVLHAATLTNRPFLKDMTPVVLSEGISNKITHMFKKEKGGVVEMELKELVGLIGLKEDATEDMVKDAIKKLSEGSKGLVEIAKSLELKEDATVDDVTAKLTEMIKKLKEMQDNTKGKVTLTEAEVKELRENAKAGKEAAEQIKKRDVADAVKFALSEGKITPAQKAWADAYALKDLEGFKKFADEAPVVVPLKERGSQESTEKVNLKDNSEEGRKKLNERAEALMTEKNVGYKEALKMARKEAEGKKE